MTKKQKTLLIAIPVTILLVGGAFWFAREPDFGNSIPSTVDLPQVAQAFAQSDLIQDYVMEGTTFTKPAKDENSVKIKIGNNTDEFTPDFYISRWEDEVYFKMKPRGLDKVAKKDKDLKFEDKKIKFKTPDIDYEMYDLGISEEHPEGAYEYEVILKKKPDSNIITFDIETQGLDFFYQPELTQKEIDEGSFMPENVIGSYAVYHSTKKNHIIGQKNYKAGKAFHIYRPQMEDANGWKVWGELNIDVQTEIKTITIPQDFIDNAVYPIKHATGQTFGNEHLGSVAWGAFNAIVCWYGESTDSGSITKLTIGIDGWENGEKIKGGIYDDNESFLTNGKTEEISTGLIDDAFNDFTYSAQPEVTSGLNYYLCIWTEASGVYRDVGTDQLYHDPVTYAENFPATYTPLSPFDFIPSIYATFGEAAPPAVAPVDSTYINVWDD